MGRRRPPRRPKTHKHEKAASATPQPPAAQVETNPGPAASPGVRSTAVNDPIANETPGELFAALRVAMQQEEADERMKMRLVMHSQGFYEGDVAQMLRGQIIHAGDCRACFRDDGESCSRVGTDSDVAPWPRLVDQSEIKGDLDFDRYEPNQLKCPLEQRGLAADFSTPCGEIQRRLSELYDDYDEDEEADDEDEEADDEAQRRAEETAQRRSLRALRRRSIYPCLVLSEVYGDHLFELLSAQGRAEPDRVLVPPKGDPQEVALQQARYLVDSQRLSAADFAELLANGIYVTGQGWLPCVDDGQRDQFERPVDPDLEVNDEEVPAARMRCPLQVRALVGDPLVGCAEAQVLHAPQSLLRAARLAHPEGLKPRDKPLDERAGTPADPVRVHALRPCQVLGNLLAADLVPFLLRFAEDQKSWARD